MRRAALALVTLAACSSPAAGYRATTGVPSTTTTEAPTTTTTTTTAPLAPSSSVPPPSTVAIPVSPPLNPPELVDTPATSGASGTTTASWYGAESGARTANGDRYNPQGLTFAHRTLSFGSRVTFCRGGTCVTAVCTDRGPAQSTGRDFDLSRGTFELLAPLSAGVATVTWTVVG